jgi:hypothetical protein
LLLQILRCYIKNGAKNLASITRKGCLMHSFGIDYSVSTAIRAKINGLLTLNIIFLFSNKIIFFYLEIILSNLSQK